MTGSSALVSLEEIQVIRLVLQFLSSRKLHKSARNLERETGITNCGYNDDVLFLRQLILDGEWDAILTYSQPLEKLEGFDAKSFRYLIFREKFMEILYFKSGVEGVSSSYSIEDMIKCLNHLETNCPTKSDYTKLCWLLTVTDLYDQPEYQGWNPETARIKCFGEVVDLLKKVMPLEKKKGNEKVLPSVSQNRLVNLVVKGLCFENCVDYCHQRAINGEVDNDGINVDNSVLAGASHESTGNFLSWLHSLPQESFVSPFEPVSLKVNFKKTSQIRKFNLSNKRLQNEAENLSKSLLMSERPSTASKVESKPVNPPESLSSVKKVSNSYSNFHYTKPNIDFKPIEPETGEGVPRRDSLNEADIPQPNNQDISTQADQNNHNSNHADQVSHSKDNKPSKREIHDSQDSLDRIKRNQENSVLKQLEEHEKQSAELRRQLMESSNVQAELHEMSPRATPNHQQQNIRHPSDGHSLPIDEDKLQTVNITSQVNSTKGRTQRESPVGKEVSPCFKDNTDNKPLQVTSTPLTKKKLIPEPLKLDNVTISRIEGPSVNESRHQDNNDMNQSHANEEKPIPESQFPKTPNALPTGHWISLADGSGTLNTSTPKSSRHQMSNTPGPLVSPVDAVEAESAIQTTNNLQPDDDKASPVIPSNDTPTPRRGPKINGVRRTLMSNGPPMSRNKGPTVPNEETPETKAPIREKSNKGGNTPRDRAPANQKQNPPKKNSREEAKPKPSVDNTGAINQANVKYTTKSSILTQQQREMSKTLEKQQGYMKNNPDAIRFCTVASLEDVQAIRAVAFHPSGDLFAVGSNSKTLRVCAATGLNNYKKLNSNEDMIPPQPTILFKRNRHHKGSIYCAAWSNTGDMLATGSNDKTIKVLRFDPENCTQVGPEMELNIHGGTVRDLVFATRSGGTSLLVSGGAGCGNVQITDTGTGNSIGQLKGHSGYIMSIYAAKDDIIATGSNDNTVRLWDLRSQRCIDAIATGESCVASVCVNPAGTLLSSGHEDGGCMIYDITAGRTLQFFKPHTLDCRSVRFSSDGHYLLTASYDTSIILLDMQYNLECNIPPYSVVAQHCDKVIQCRWHPQLMAFLSSSADKTASLWTLDC